MAGSIIKKCLNWAVDTFHAPWLDEITTVKGKETAEVKEGVFEGFIPATNPATKTFVPVPVVSSKKKGTRYFLLLDFLGKESRLPTTQAMFASAEAGYQLRIRYKLNHKGDVKAIRIAEIVKNSPEKEV